ncbi:MAG TPA: winged helix-turn-helix domain-containing protein [Caldilineaceae bacterium]|nr:winged helix-turn-helix domain-containing protein [Caldilineaceae bacterium]
MPDSLRLVDGGYMRRPDIHHIIQELYNLHCVEVIGFSNIGKSALLRLLAQADIWTQELGEAGHEFLPVYIDCNRMLEMSDQGFYELILRCLQESSPQLAALPDLVGAYETLVTPSSEFQVPLSFNRGLTTALQSTRRKLVLLLDEFDEPFSQIDSRVFLNLRALKDRHQGALTFVTAVGKPLTNQRPGDHCGEFCELFSHHTWYLAPLTRSDVDRFVRRYVTIHEVELTGADIDFLYEWAGGHPRLLEAICRLLAHAVESANSSTTDPIERWQLHRSVARSLRADETIQLECEKIWQRLSEVEQQELLGLFAADHQPDQLVLASLMRQHLLRKGEGKPQFFCRLMSEFVQRQALHTQSETSALWVDMESGEVLVDDKPVETLTNLEYRLMLLLFQNADKIIDKYQIVSHVWGDEYIDEVDDARIEKLVSRLRQKIERDPSSPHFLTTVRGRGYRLVTE